MLNTKIERKRHYSENMRILFGATVDLYYDEWGDFLHLALFDENSDGDYTSAFEATHNLYWKAICGSSCNRILELATGGGALSAWMARRNPAEIVAIDICPAQLNKARERVRRFGLKNLRIVEHDIMELERLNEGTFDAVVFLDAACYLPNKQKAIDAIGEVMNKGGRFLLVDWCRPDKVTALENELILEPLYRHWAIPEMETATNYKRFLERAGLELIEHRDLSDAVYQNWVDGYSRAIHPIRNPMNVEKLAAIAKLTATYGTRGIKYAKNQFYAVLFAKLAAEAGLLKYSYFLTQK